MDSKCKYCGGKIALGKNDEWVCIECGTVVGPLIAWPRRRLTRKETVLALLHGYA